MKTYEETHRFASENPGEFWMDIAERISWSKKPTRAFETTEQGIINWFPDGELNTCYLAVDRHIENGRGDATALIYDSPVTNTKEKFTFLQLKEHVSKLAGLLRQSGVERGDRVVLYMPMIPEAVFGMLACARIGAVHSVVFGGFAPHELALRIDDAQPKVILSASCGIEIDRVIDYKPMLDDAISKAVFKPKHTIIVQRPMQKAMLWPGRDIDYEEGVKNAVPADIVPLKSTDPLYILYTSGTTGKPKGIQRDNGGHAVALKYSMDEIYNTAEGEVFWAASDVGWVVGHSYIVYGPLINGCATILYEGKPIRTPDAGAFWRITEEYKVNTLFTAPTAFRAIKKEDPNGTHIRKYDITSLKALFLAGERCDVPTWYWATEQLQLPVVDHWWQTESGWPIVARMPNLDPSFEFKPGSAGKPVCGFDVQIVNDNGELLIANQEGNVVIKLPLPPGCLPTLYNDNSRFFSSYLERFPGYYFTGDGGYIDDDGYVFIMGRVDDVINVAGHRLSTGEMEEMVATHPAIAECAVVGIADELKGQLPLAYIVLKDGIASTEKEIEMELVTMIRDNIGAVACFKNCIQVKRLPKTRSGKILRRLLRNIADGEHYIVPSTIDEPVILTEIHDVLRERKLGKAFLHYT
jgi:acyl-coenzyme A synthetase/AMP-(fatty) acid ligase